MWLVIMTNVYSHYDKGCYINLKLRNIRSFYLYLGNIHHICLMQHIPISGLQAENRKGKGSHSLLVIATIAYYHSR